MSSNGADGTGRRLGAGSAWNVYGGQGRRSDAQERGGEDGLKLTVAADQATAKATVELVEQHGSASVTLSQLDFQLQ